MQNRRELLSNRESMQEFFSSISNSCKVLQSKLLLGTAKYRDGKYILFYSSNILVALVEPKAYDEALADASLPLRYLLLEGDCKQSEIECRVETTIQGSQTQYLYIISWEESRVLADL